MEQKPWTRRELLGVTSMAGLAVLSVTTSLGAAAASHYEKVVLAKQPVAYWRLGEAEGPDALDSTANGHRGTYHGTPAFHERGAIKGDANTAIKLDGKRSYIEIANHKDFSQPTSGKGLTIEVWVRPDVLAFEGETQGDRILSCPGEYRQQVVFVETAEQSFLSQTHLMCMLLPEQIERNVPHRSYVCRGMVLPNAAAIFVAGRIS